MSPVSPVSSTEVTVSIGLKNVLRVKTSFPFNLEVNGNHEVQLRNKRGQIPPAQIESRSPGK